MEPTPEQKKKRIETVAKVVIAGVVGLAVSPFIFLAVKGLIGLLLAGVVGFTALQFTPVVAMKIANWRLKAIIDEANKNPIETMNNVFIENMKIIKEKDNKIAQFEASLNDFRVKAEQFKRKHPENAYQINIFKTTEQKMSVVLTRKKDKQKIAKKAASEFHEQIVLAEDIYAVATAAHAVEALSGDAEQEVFQDIKKRVSFDSVMHQFNVAVAEMSIEADTEPDMIADTPVKGALPEDVGFQTLPQAQVIDAVPVEAKAVRR